MHRALVLALLPVCGCGGDPPPETTAECTGDAYLPGMQKTCGGGACAVVLAQSTPAPPEKGDNRWRLQLLDGGGAPIDQAELTVAPFMPEHGHGTSIDAVITPEGGGFYDVWPINLWMPGLWQVRVGVSAPAASVRFDFCIEG